ncbi:hypothetical protein [Thalassospira sp. CH_XMU1458]
MSLNAKGNIAIAGQGAESVANINIATFAGLGSAQLSSAQEQCHS